MILDFLLDQRDELLLLQPEDDWRAITTLLEQETSLPLGLSLIECVACARSTLARHVLQVAKREAFGRTIPTIQQFREHRDAEASRLFVKGVTLFEHCLEEHSFACMMGFFEHELTKSRGAERLIVRLMGFMESARREMTDPSRASEYDFAAVMIDLGFSYLHGLSRSEALELVDHLIPLDL